MRRTTALGFTTWAALALCGAPASGDEELELRWSLSPIFQAHFLESPDDDDGVTGFFDQYEFVPDKSYDFPVQVGVRDAELDLFGEGQTPLLQVRLDSPTSNLGFGGSQVRDPFFNQRLLALARFRPLEVDLRYWRMRTEELRLFPNTAEGALVFEDLTDRDDRFTRDRTGFRSEIRAGLPALLGERGAVLDPFGGPELSLRGGYEARGGDRQRRFLLAPANRWIGLSQNRDQQVGEVGGGVLLAPWQRLTLALDFDHERFRENEDALLRGMLGGGPPASGTIGFTPDTDRFTGRMLLRSPLGDRAVVEGGFQASLLEQVDAFAPQQRAAGLRDNQVLQLSANLAGDVALTDALSANAFVGFEQRHNDIERDTPLFDPSVDGTFTSAFMERWTRWRATLEGVYRLDAGSRLALGARLESVDRDLDFADPGLLHVVPGNAFVTDDSESYTFYGRTWLRLLRRVSVLGELGYRVAPETGYPTDLDGRVYGKLRASYTLPLERAVVLSLFARGGSGENDDEVQTLVGGVGESPAGARLRRSFERTEWLWGLTATASPTDRVGVFASLFLSRDSQDYELVLSSLQRYFQPAIPITFSEAGDTEYRDDRLNVLLGTHVQLGERTDAGLSYSFTRAETRYAGGSPELSLISRWREIDADVHGFDLELGHWLRDGLRVTGGYRFQYFDDRSRLPESTGSVVDPFDLTTTRHIVTVGVTLTSALLDE